MSSDEDEFYDRTTKKTSNRKGGDSHSIETADTLLDKKDAITNEIEEKKKLVLAEKDRMASENVATSDADALDAYMLGLSSQLGKHSVGDRFSIYLAHLSFVYYQFFSLGGHMIEDCKLFKFLLNSSP